MESLYREWAAKRKIRVGDGKVEFDFQDKNINDFFIDITGSYYNEMKQYLRKTGVKIPVSGTNWGRNASLLLAEQVTDFTNNNVYWDLKRFNIVRKFDNISMTGSINNLVTRAAFNRAQDKPFFVTEWNALFPNEWRAEVPLFMASAGSFQGWSGFTEHNYRSHLDQDVERISNEKGTYGGNLYTFNDPARFGLHYHAALIFRRGDVRQAEKTVSVKIDDPLARPGIKALQLTAEKHGVMMVVHGMTAKGDIVIRPDETIVDLEKGEVFSDTRELYRNWNKKIGWIDTPNTKVVYGLVGKEGEISLTDIKVNVKTDFATVAISTLTGDPIKSSRNMLLTAIGRADNTNSKYNRDHTEQYEAGTGPILVEVINALIEIKTDVKNLRVLAISPRGNYSGIVPSEYKDANF